MASDPDGARLPPPDPLYASLRAGEDDAAGADPSAARRDREFRDVLGRFCTGVTVVTSTLGDEPVGMTCQSFASVSLEPPLVLFCAARASRSWPLIRESGHFCVNLLSQDQLDVSAAFASKGADKFAGVAWRPSATGAPLLDGVLGWVDCTIHAVHPAGDHDVVIGRVEDLGTQQADGAVPPLLYFRGQYHRPRP